MTNVKLFYLLALFCFAIAVHGCTRNNTEPQAAACPALEGDTVVLAIVDGSDITRYDVEYTVKSAFGENALNKLNDDVRKKVLESLVASRAISQAIESELTPCDKLEIDKKMNAHREELLIQKYLARHAQPEPVSMDMIRSYYQEHPEEFGGKTARIFEMIFSSRHLTAQERDSLLAAHEIPSQKTDWKDWAEKLRQKGYPVSYRTGELSEGFLDEKLLQMIRPLKLHEASDFTFIDGALYAARITEEKKLAPRPLEDVSAQIRNSLAPVQIKKAVKTASDQALKTAKVTYK